MKNIILFALVIILAGGAGFGLQRYIQHDSQPLSPIIPDVGKQDLIGTMRPAFELEDLDQQARHIDEFNGKVVLINFWATWCPPCKKEMPAFIELQEQYAEQDFQIIGVALDDKESVQDFADTLGVNYPLMAAEYEGLSLSRIYGNHIGVLPYSVFVGRDGKIAQTKAGELSKLQVKLIIQPLLDEK